MRKYYIYSLASLAICAAFLWLLSGRHEGAKPETSKTRASSQSSMGSHAEPPRSPQPKPAEIVTLESACRQHGLSDVQLFSVRTGLRWLVADLIEQKSHDATVTFYDGTTLRLDIPRLVLDEKTLNEKLRAKLVASLGTEKADAILGDEQAKQSIMDWMHLRKIVAEASYSFVRTRPETDPGTQGRTGMAAFNVEISFNLPSQGSSRQQESAREIHTGLAYTEIYQTTLGWNAMAKAPAGFFRKDPIVGVASRPPPMIVAIEDIKTGETEVLNARHPGSKDILH